MLVSPLVSAGSPAPGTAPPAAARKGEAAITASTFAAMLALFMGLPAPLPDPPAAGADPEGQAQEAASPVTPVAGQEPGFPAEVESLLIAQRFAPEAGPQPVPVPGQPQGVNGPATGESEVPVAGEPRLGVPALPEAAQQVPDGEWTVEFAVAPASTPAVVSQTAAPAPTSVRRNTEVTPAPVASTTTATPATIATIAEVSHTAAPAPVRRNTEVTAARAAATIATIAEVSHTATPTPARPDTEVPAAPAAAPAVSHTAAPTRRDTPRAVASEAAPAAPESWHLAGLAPAVQPDQTGRAEAKPAEPPPRIQTPIDPDRLMDAIARTSGSAKDGRYTVTLRLHPETLGEVRLQVQITGRDVATVMQVTTPDAKQALEQRGDMLRQSLDQAGLTLSGFQVSTGSQGRSPRDRTDDTNELPAQGRRNRPVLAAAAPAGRPSAPVRKRAGMLDTLA